MTNPPETTQNINPIPDFITSKAHIYINSKKNGESGAIKKEMVYNIDITKDDNLKKLSEINSEITENQENNTMFNMNPVNKDYPAYIYFEINNELNQSFSGSFYVSFDTELFESGDTIPISKIEVNKEKIKNSKDIYFTLLKSDNKYYINVTGAENEAEITNYKSNDAKTLSFLVLYNYNENVLTIGINEKDDIFTIPTYGIIVKSLIFGNKETENIFNTKNKNNIMYNCLIGGVRFYNKLNTFSQLRNSAYFKAPLVPKTTEQKKEIIDPEESIGQDTITNTNTTTTTTTTKPVIDIINIKVFTGFTNYSPSAELFKNI